MENIKNTFIESKLAEVTKKIRQLKKYKLIFDKTEKLYYY